MHVACILGFDSAFARLVYGLSGKFRNCLTVNKRKDTSLVNDRC